MDPLNLIKKLNFVWNGKKEKLTNNRHNGIDYV